jgi:elongation factor Tu
MAKKLTSTTNLNKFVRVKPHCNIGTIGHVDHGKTTLTAAITRCLQGIGSTLFRAYHEIDSHVEERTRGITINAAHIEYETEKRHYSHIDCPGHQQYVKNMLTGAVQMEGAILVVAVNDGPQIQTREHIILAKEVSISYMVVYINKLDSMLESDMKDLVELEVRELLESYGFPEDLPVIKGSARKALNEDEISDLGGGSVKLLMDTVDSYIKQPIRLHEVPFLLSIEGVFMAEGRGTVLTGKVETGILKLGDPLELIGGREALTTLCMGLEMFHKSLEFAEAGDNVGVLVRHVKRQDAKRGFVLAAPDFIKAYVNFDAKIYILTKKEGGRHKAFVSNYKPQFFFRTANMTGTITLPEDIAAAMPGDSLIVNVELVERVALNVGLRFVMREGNLTIGAGVITKL